MRRLRDRKMFQEEKRGQHDWNLVREKGKRSSYREIQGRFHGTLKMIIVSIDFILSVMGSHQKT